MWIDTLPNMTVASGGVSTVSLMTGFSESQTRLQRMTLVRTIIGLDIARLTHDSGEGSEQVFLGIGVATQEAFVAAGGLPLANDMTAYPRMPWVWRAAYRVYGFAADQPAVFNRRVDLDIRAQRKLENGECYLTVTNTIFEGSNSVVTISGIIRQLWMI